MFPHDYATKIARNVRHELHPYRKELQHFTSPRGNIYVSGVRRSLNMDNDLTQFEPETIRWIDTHFKGGDCVWDIGANVGLYSSYIVKIPDITLISFEPHSATHTDLFENVMQNNEAGNKNNFSFKYGAGFR